MKTSNQIAGFLILLSLIMGVDKTGTSAAKFLSIGSGAQAVGMGGAYTSIDDDASSMYWNPAGIARIDKMELYIDHSNWLADIRYDYTGFILPLTNSSALGLNFTSLSMPEMNVTRYGEEETGETFKAGSYAIGAAWAISLTDRFSIGFNGKYIREFISRSHASTIALDVGTLFNTIYGPTLGMNISNFGPKMQMGGADLLIKTDDVSNNPDINTDLSTEQFNLPLVMRFGISNRHSMGKMAVLWAVDAISPMDNSEYLNMGCEVSFFDQVFVRAGAKSVFMVDREEIFTIGGGVKMSLFSHHNIQLDFAYEVMRYLNHILKFSICLTN